MYEFPPQFPFIIRARVCRGCLSSVLFCWRRILFVPGEGYVGYIEQGSGWTWLGFIFRNLRDLIIRQWYISSSLSLFVLQRQDRPLNIFPPRQETGCEALFYGWRASTFYPESPSLNVLRSCNECWSSSNDWTEMVERKPLRGCARLCSKRLARMERAISFQTRGIPKSMFSQKRAFHPADLLAVSIYINIYWSLFQGDF